MHHPNPEQDPDFNDRGAQSYDMAEFQGRRPILADPTNRHVYVGEPNWYHYDVEKHHDLADTWNMNKGYFGAQGKDWGNGKLAWYGGENEHHNDIAQALIEAGFDIPNPGQYALDEGLKEPSPDIDWDDDEND